MVHAEMLNQIGHPYVKIGLIILRYAMIFAFFSGMVSKKDYIVF